MKTFPQYLLFVNFLEDILEPAIITFQNGVLCAHVQWPLLLQCIREAGMGKASDRLQYKLSRVLIQSDKILPGCTLYFPLPASDKGQRALIDYSST